MPKKTKKEKQIEEIKEILKNFDPDELDITLKKFRIMINLLKSGDKLLNKLTEAKDREAVDEYITALMTNE